MTSLKTHIPIVQH